MLTRPIAVPSLLQFIYGERTTLQNLLLIHGSAVIASLLVLLWSSAFANWTIIQALAASVLIWDFVGGGVAHLLPDNRQYWRTMRTEWLVVWVASYAWQPLLFIYAFDGSLPVLAALHLGSIVLVLTQQMLTNRYLLLWVLLAFGGGLLLNQFIGIPTPLSWFAPLYLVKAALFDKAVIPIRKPRIRTNPFGADDSNWA